MAATLSLAVVDADIRDVETALDFVMHPNAILVNSVRDMVSQLVAQTTANQIETLQVFGHGMRGAQFVGGGLHADPDTQVLMLDRRGRLIQREYLALLCGRFTRAALVRLHGCRIARGGAGRGLLRALADLWNVRVQGALDRQIADRSDALEGCFIEADGTEDRRPILRRESN